MHAKRNKEAEKGTIANSNRLMSPLFGNLVDLSISIQSKHQISHLSLTLHAEVENTRLTRTMVPSEKDGLKERDRNDEQRHQEI